MSNSTSTMQVNALVGHPTSTGETAKPQLYDAIFRDGRLGMRVEPHRESGHVFQSNWRSVVTHVEAGGQADAQGVEVGSVVAGVDNVQPKDAAHLVSMLKNGRRPLVIRFRRGELQDPSSTKKPALFGFRKKGTATSNDADNLSSHIGEINIKKNAPRHLGEVKRGAQKEQQPVNTTAAEAIKEKGKLAKYRSRKERERQQKTRIGTGSGQGALLGLDWDFGGSQFDKSEHQGLEQGPTGGGADDSEYEAALVNGLCGAGGISRHPPQDKLEEFLPICGSLKVERVGQLIQEHLASSREKENEKALHVVDLLCQTPGAEEYREYFHANHQEIMQLSNSKKRPLRNLASSILSQLSIVGVGDLLGAFDDSSMMPMASTAPPPAGTQILTNIDDATLEQSDGTSMFDFIDSASGGAKESTGRSWLSELSKETKKQISMEGLQLFARANSGAMRLAPDDATTQKAARPDFSDDFGMMEFAAPIEQHAPSTAPSQATAGPSQDMDLSMFLQNLSLQKFEGALAELGVETITDLEDLEESDLDSIGMKVVHKRRLKKEGVVSF